MIGDKIVEESSKLLPEIYKDLAKPVFTQVGEVSGRTAKALLAPLRGLLWSWENVEKLIEEFANEKLEKIPIERRKTPPPEIAIPLIQSLSYTAQNETLRDLYLNLLANSMDEAKNKDVHPSFVEIIRQMNSLDAKVFEKLSSNIGYQKLVSPSIGIKNQDKYFTNATPEWFTGWTIDGHDIFEVSSSVIRLSKFGLIELMFDRTAGEGVGEILKSHQDLLNILSIYKERFPGEELEVKAIDSILYVNDFGKQFQRACKL